MAEKVAPKKIGVEQRVDIDAELRRLTRVVREECRRSTLRAAKETERYRARERRRRAKQLRFAANRDRVAAARRRLECGRDTLSGREQLLLVAQITTAKEIAARCRVSPMAVSYWLAGTKRPSRRVRDVIEKYSGFDIPAESWGRQPTRPE